MVRRDSINGNADYDDTVKKVYTDDSKRLVHEFTLSAVVTLASCSMSCLTMSVWPLPAAHVKHDMWCYIAMATAAATTTTTTTTTTWIIYRKCTQCVTSVVEVLGITNDGHFPHPVSPFLIWLAIEFFPHLVRKRTFMDNRHCFLQAITQPKH